MREISHLIASQAWLMDERVATLLYHQYMTGRLSLVDLKTKSQLHAHLAAMGQQIGTHVAAYKVKSKSGKNVAVMPVYGTLTKRGEMCSYGMRDYQSEIAALNANEDISGIVMDMEGPGGTVDGLNEFGMAIRGSKKPIVTFGDNMVASADYWAASQSNWIIGNKYNPTKFGSIGVLCVHEFLGKYIEENIGQVKIIRAPQSTDKALINPLEELTPDLEAQIKSELKDCASTFFSTVKKGRGASLKEDEKVWGTGKEYNLKDSIDIGLIDAQGSLLDAINKAAELSGGNSTTTNNGKNKSMKIKTVAGNLLNKMRGGAKGKAAEGESAAATDSTPVWTADMVFNTDGSGDGAYCLHEDTDGNQRKWETKIDNNQGNEPSSDPTVFEDDNWVDVEDEVEPEETAPGTEGTDEKPAAGLPTIDKLNAALIKSQREVKALRVELKKYRDEKRANEDKPAAPATTVVSKGDKNPGKDPGKMQSWEKKAARKVGALKDEVED